MKRSRIAIMLVLMLLLQLSSGVLAAFAEYVAGDEDGSSVTDSVYGGGGSDVTDAVYGPDDDDDTVGGSVYDPPGFGGFSFFGMGGMTGMSGMSGGAPVVPAEVSNTENGTSLTLSAGYLFGDIVLGQQRTIQVAMTNETGAYQFNVGVELVLGDGLDIVEPSPSSVTEDEVTGAKTAYWKDIKNLQAGESFVFPITVQSTDEYRVPKAAVDPLDPDVTDVPFGEEIPLSVKVYHSADARVIYGPDTDSGGGAKIDPGDPDSPNKPTVSVGMDWRVVPFMIIPSDAPKAVKGAGPDETETDEWGEFSFSFTVINNSRYATNFGNLTSTTDGAVQIYSLSDGGTVGKNIADNERSFGWTNLTIGDGEERELTLNGAFLNKTMDPLEGDNQGTLIADGFRPDTQLVYSASPVGGGSYGAAGEGNLAYNLAVAKDIIVSKSVSPTSDIGYGTELEYTIRVKTNEYYPVADVVVTDTIGDGQTLDVDSITGPGDFTLDDVSYNNTNGTWSVVWSVYGPQLDQEQVRTFSYKTIVDENWSHAYGGAPIYAGDAIVGDVKVEGNTVVSGDVSDSDSTHVAINTPGISETITALNEIGGLDLDLIVATVGDTIEFTVAYDATDVDAKQHNVEIRDYLPLGSVPLAWYTHAKYGSYDPEADPAFYVFDDYTFTYTLGEDTLTSKPLYYPASNMLVWSFPQLDESTGRLTATVIAHVENDLDHVEVDKGDRNLVTLSYQNSPGRVESKRADVQVDYTSPLLSITREVANDSTGNPGEWKPQIEVNGTEQAWVKLTIENMNSVPAYNVVLKELLPDDFSGQVITPNAGAFTFGPNSTISVDEQERDAAVFTLDDPIQPGASFVITYKTTIINDIGTGTEITQAATVEYNSQPAGSDIPDEEWPRDYRIYLSTEGPGVTMTVPGPQIVYERVHYGTTDFATSTKSQLSDSDFSNMRVGDWVVYKVSVDIPEHDVAYNPELTITLPGNHAVDAVFKDNYDKTTFDGTTPLTEGIGYTVAGGKLTLDSSVLPEITGLSSIEHVFFVRTIATGISVPANLQQTQSSSAEFNWTWAVDSPSGEKKTISASPVNVTVKLPKLEAKWQYESAPSVFTDYNDANPVSLSKGESVRMRFVVTNAGQHTAYDFEPVITAPLGFKITDPDAGGDLSTPDDETEDRVVTFTRTAVRELAAGATVSYTMTVEMVEVPGSGASFSVEGTTGDYFAATYAYDRYTDTPGSIYALEKHAAVGDTALLGVPEVLVTNIIRQTTNTEDNNRTTPATSKTIRPGDVVTYELTVTVPAGTQAFDLTLEDQIASYDKFVWMSGSGSVTWNQEDVGGNITPAPVSLVDGDYNAATGKLTLNFGDSPNPASVKSADGTVTYTVSFRMIAGYDGSKPQDANPAIGGSFRNGNSESVNPSSSAHAEWNTTGTVAGIDKTTLPAKTTALTVQRPNLSYTASTVSMFTEANPTRTVSYTLTNSGLSTAFVPSFEVLAPAGFTVSSVGTAPAYGSGTVAGSTTDESGATRVGWAGFVVAPGAPVVLTFSLTATAAIGAAEEGHSLVSTLEEYHSTEAQIDAPVDGEQQAKEYLLVTTGPNTSGKKTQPLTIDSAKLTATLIGNSNGNDLTAPVVVRQGDILVYELKVDVPGDHPAYNVVLSEDLFAEQTVIGVERDGVNVIPLTADGYELGDMLTDTTFRVIVKVDSDDEPGAAPSYVPSITYNAVKDDENTEKTASAARLEQTIASPELTVSVTADPGILTTPGQESEIAIVVENEGDSAAYAAQAVITIEHGGLFAYDDDGAEANFIGFGAPFDIASVDGLPSAGTLTVDLAETTADTLVLNWSFTSIAASGQAALVWKVKAKNDTELGEQIVVTADIKQYQSLPLLADFNTVLAATTLTGKPNADVYLAGLTPAITSGSYYGVRLYEPIDVSDSDDVTLSGSFTLSAASPNTVTRFAGEGTSGGVTGSVTFEHSLENTGAGADRYTLSVEGLTGIALPASLDGQTAAELIVDGNIVLAGKWSEDDDKLLWTCAPGVSPADCDDSAADEAFRISLPVSGEADVHLKVYVSEYLSYTAIASLVYEITATADKVAPPGKVKSVTDHVNLTGTVLDGWTGDIADKTAWDQLIATYKHGEAPVLYAETANHIQRVEFDIQGTDIEDLTMTLFNPGTYLTDGKKLWKYTGSVSLLDELSAGTYNVIFRSYEDAVGNDQDGTDAVAAVAPGLNNTLVLVAPSLSLSVTVDEDELASTDDESTVTIKVSNNGTSEAHAIVIHFEMDPSVGGIFQYEELTEAPELTGVLTGDFDNGYVWTIPSLDVDEELEITFKISAPVTTLTGESVQVVGHIESYESLDTDGYTYGPEAPEDASVTIMGSHTLTANASDAVASGQTASYSHTLTNTGAGADTYLIAIANGDVRYPVTLYIGGTKVADGVWNGTAWAWTFAAGSAAYNISGTPGVALDADEDIAVRLDVHVPESAKYGSTVYTYTVTAAAVNSDHANQTVSDTLTITGDALDGWSGNGARAGWAKPVYQHGQGLVLQAVTANHIRSVYAEIEGTGIDSLKLELVNGDDQLGDYYIIIGEKHWKFTDADADLLDSLSADTYGVTFRAYTDDPGVADDLDQTDAASALAPGDNNQLDVIVPGLNITMATDGGLTTLTDTADERTMTVSVTNNGDSIAYDVQVDLSVDKTAEFTYGQLNGNIAWTPATGYQWDIAQIAIGQTVTLTFTVRAPATTEVGTTVEAEADLVEYYSLPGTAQGLKYGNSQEPSVEIEVVGSHTLTADASDTVASGQTASYAHTLTNTGAGADTYLIAIANGDVRYPVTLYIGGTKVADGEWNSTAWAWTFAPGGAAYNISGTPGVALDADEDTAVRLDVHVPESAKYGPTVYTYTVTAESVNSDHANQSVSDELTITGIALDGWSGNGARAGWAKPVYQHGQGLVLQAVTANHIRSVYAEIEGTGIDSLKLELMNGNAAEADYYITVGEKRWTFTDADADLLDSLSSDTYGVTFRAYTDDPGVAEDQTDATGASAPGDNNPLDVIVPNIAFLLQAIDPDTESPLAGPVVLTEPEDTATFKLTVTNSGTSIAYDVLLQMQLEPGLLIQAIGDSSDLSDTVTPNAGNTGFDWTMEEVPANGGQRTIIFTVTAPVATTVNDALDVSANVEEYFSLAGGGKQYGPLVEQTIPVKVSGGHTLTANASDEVASGQTASYSHTLTNTGAGADTYLIAIANGDVRYPVTLYIGGTEVAGGQWNGTAWVWNFAAGGAAYNISGMPGVALDADEDTAVRLDVHVPESAKYGPTVYTYTVTAESVNSDHPNQSVSDTLTITGIALDGWSGNGARAGWTKPVYQHGQGLVLQAVTANHIRSVYAELEGTGIDSLKLELVNGDDQLGDYYITIGEKHWRFADTDADLLDSLSADTYGVTFRAYTEDPGVAEDLDQTDAASALAPGDNNPLDVIVPGLNIAMATDGGLTTLTDTSDVRTVTVSVTNNGDSIAYDVQVDLSVDKAAEFTYGQLNGSIAWTPAAGYQWDIAQIAIGQTVTLTFTVRAPATTEVGTTVEAEADLVEYYSLPGTAQGLKYENSQTPSATIEVVGSHTLTANASDAVTAGKTASYAHTLTNTGAGADTYLITIANGDVRYPATLYIGGVAVADGEWNSLASEWTWTFTAGGASYNIGGYGTPGVELDADEATAIRLDVHVPESAPYGLTVYTYTVTADAVHSNHPDQSVGDTLTIEGVALDGWSGETTYAQMTDPVSPVHWTLPTYGLVDSVFLRAISAVHVRQVHAEIVVDTEDSGGTPGTRTLIAELELANPDSYIQDGYKLWTGATRLPNGVKVVSDEYPVKFTALDQHGTQLEEDSIDENIAVAANNPIAVETTVTVKGTITTALPPAHSDYGPIEGALVELYDAATNERKAYATTGADGKYEFPNVDVANYKLVVSKDGYSNSTKYFYALPEYGTTEVIVDAQLSPYQITLFADPTSLLGDGDSETVLTAIITDRDGEPLAGVTAVFNSPSGKGSFPDGTTAVTDENGVAKVRLKSDAVGGTSSVWFPVFLEVSDPVHDLYASTQIVITFEPGAIVGIVTEFAVDADGNKVRNGNDELIKVPVEGAIVEVSNAEIGFYARYVTDASGDYKIGVPVGGINYQVTITKPVVIGGVRQFVSFPQTAPVGVITGLIGAPDHPVEQAASGLVLQRTPTGETARFDNDMYNKMELYLIDPADPNTRIPAVMNTDGTFYRLGLEAKEYRLYVTLRDPVSGDSLAIASGSVIITADGEMNITTELVDPYGDVRNDVTDKLIKGASVTLYYWGDPVSPGPIDPNWTKSSNRANWVKVELPELLNFPPFDNESPTQKTGEEGLYAWMVYPETDYFIVATAPGYYQYISDRIRVDWDIVEHNIRMKPIPPDDELLPIKKPIVPEESTGIEIDLAIDISADQRSYMEQTPIELTIDFLNRSSVPATDVVISMDLPANTTVIDLGGGELSEDGTQVLWRVETLEGGQLDRRTVKLQAGVLAASEQEIIAKAVIASRDELINLNDDESDLKLMLFSNRYGVFTHQRYIVGYPDGEFKPEKYVTRAEIANIFARILQLRKFVLGETVYTDVPRGQWYTDGVEAVTRRGLFQGYADGTFRPNQPITRAEFTIVVGKFLELSDRPPVVIGFKDLTGHWAANIIENVRRNRVASGYIDGSFKPNEYLVRSEAVTMINRMLYRGPLHGVDPSYLDVTGDDWEHGDVEESTRSHKARRNPDSSEEHIEDIDTTLGF